MRTFKKIGFALLLLVLFSQAAFSQCAMCKAAAESDLQNNPHSLAKGINEGILFLLVIPYILVAFFFRKELLHFFKNISKK